MTDHPRPGDAERGSGDPSTSAPDTSAVRPGRRRADRRTPTGHTDSSGSESRPARSIPALSGRRRTEPRRGFIRRHLSLTSLASVLVLMGCSAGGYLWWLNEQLDNIPRAEMGIEENAEKNGNEGGKPLNILLIGADHGQEGQSVAEDLEDGEWTPYQHLSDTLMIAHIPADRKSVQLVSIPRDTWVEIDGYPAANNRGKLNAAFSYGGPAMSLQAVEDLTDVTIDHVAIIDWVGFRDLTSALGGVRVYIPETFEDTSQNVIWEQGWQTLEGERALQYVRTRYGLENGDFDRIKRQQNFMRSTMSTLLSGSTTRNPVKVTKVVGVVTRYLTVDDTWDNDEIRDLALSLRDVSTKDVDFITAPLGKYDRSADGQSIVRLAPKKSGDLFQAIEDDDIPRYLDLYPDQGLGSPTTVN